MLVEEICLWERKIESVRDKGSVRDREIRTEKEWENLSLRDQRDREKIKKKKIER